MRGIILALVAALVAATLWPAAGNAGQQGPRWERLIGSSTFDSAGGIARAPDGSLYVAGTIGGKRFASAVKPGGKDIALLKLSPGGAVAWVRFLGGNGDDVGTDVAIHDNALYVSGYGNSPTVHGVSTSGGNDAIVARYTLAGRRSWVRVVGTDRDDRANSVAAGPSGVVIAGRIGSARNRPANDVDLFAASFDPAGKETWRTVLGGPGFDSGEGVALASGDGGGVAYVTGWTAGPRFQGRKVSGDADLVLASLTPAGKTNWLRVFGGGMMDQGAGVAVGPDGAVGVTGNADMAICCGQPAKWGSVLVQQYTSAGKLQWQRKERRPGFNYGADVVYDDTRHLYVVGNSGGEPFDAGDSQLVLLKYQSDGPKHIRRYFGGPAQDHPAGIAVDDTSIYLVGTSNGLDGQPSHGETDIAVFRTPNGPLARHVRTHPEGTRTGVEAVDDVLDLVEGNDRDGIIHAVDWELVPCDNGSEPAVITPPRCPPGTPDETPVEVVKVACATWRYVRPASLGGYLRMALNNDRGLFGVEETKLGDSLGILPPNGYGILLAIREGLRPPGITSNPAKDAPDADGFLIGIGEHGITGFWFGCGMSPASMLWKQAEWLLAPVGHQE